MNMVENRLKRLGGILDKPKYGWEILKAWEKVYWFWNSL